MGTQGEKEGKLQWNLNVQLAKSELISPLDSVAPFGFRMTDDWPSKVLFGQPETCGKSTAFAFDFKNRVSQLAK